MSKLIKRTSDYLRARALSLIVSPKFDLHLSWIDHILSIHSYEVLWSFSYLDYFLIPYNINQVHKLVFLFYNMLNISQSSYNDSKALTRSLSISYFIWIQIWSWSLDRWFLILPILDDYQKDQHENNCSSNSNGDSNNRFSISLNSQTLLILLILVFWLRF